MLPRVTAGSLNGEWRRREEGEEFTVSLLAVLGIRLKGTFVREGDPALGRPTASASGPPLCEPPSEQSD
jgi:hypothetical protein